MAERKKAILLVEDNPGILKVLALKLKLEGYNVLTARDGRKAMELLKSEKPDILLLDLLLPEMDGLEVLEKLQGSSGIPVVAFSAHKDMGRKALMLGARAFIAKPFDPDSMVRKTREILAEE